MARLTSVTSEATSQPWSLLFLGSVSAWPNNRRAPLWQDPSRLETERSGVRIRIGFCSGWVFEWLADGPESPLDACNPVGSPRTMPCRESVHGRRWLSRLPRL